MTKLKEYYVYKGIAPFGINFALYLYEIFIIYKEHSYLLKYQAELNFFLEKIMLVEIDTTHSNILDAVFREFNGHPVYGIEFILDELSDQKEVDAPLKNDLASTDWFGLTDY